MKSENYDELMDKFYAGTASAEEISLLQSEKLFDDLDILYAEAINSERDEKMNWKFEDFMKEIPAAKVVALPAGRGWMKKMFAAAAVVAAILTAYVFWPQQNQSNEIANGPAFHQQIKVNETGDNSNPTVSIKNEQPLAENIKPESKANKNYAVKSAKQVLPKNRINTAKEKSEGKTNTQDFLVVVNGKAITNKEEAVAIMRESVSMVSRHLTSAVDELRPLSEIKIAL